MRKVCEECQGDGVRYCTCWDTGCHLCTDGVRGDCEACGGDGTVEAVPSPRVAYAVSRDPEGWQDLVSQAERDDVFAINSQVAASPGGSPGALPDQAAVSCCGPATDVADVLANGSECQDESAAPGVLEPTPGATPKPADVVELARSELCRAPHSGQPPWWWLRMAASDVVGAPVSGAWCCSCSARIVDGDRVKRTQHPSGGLAFAHLACADIEEAAARELERAPDLSASALAAAGSIAAQKTYTARSPGVCVACREPYERGAPIRKKAPGSAKRVHEECARLVARGVST